MLCVSLQFRCMSERRWVQCSLPPPRGAHLIFQLFLTDFPASCLVVASVFSMYNEGKYAVLWSYFFAPSFFRKTWSLPSCLDQQAHLHFWSSQLFLVSQLLPITKKIYMLQGEKLDMKYGDASPLWVLFFPGFWPLKFLFLSSNPISLNNFPVLVNS